MKILTNIARIFVGFLFKKIEPLEKYLFIVVVGGKYPKANI